MDAPSRSYTIFDRLIEHVDTSLKTLFDAPDATFRKNPAEETKESYLNKEEKRHAAGLMRINHSGEIAAQALYHGQALTAKNPEIKVHLQQSAKEEGDHLYWCEQRLTELDSHISYFKPIWYSGSYLIGALAGLAGDKISLGFVEETEYQVMQHLDKHMQKLPSTDEKSRKILQQMHDDEKHHAAAAKQRGAQELPAPIKKAMSLIAKVMTTTAYWV